MVEILYVSAVSSAREFEVMKEFRIPGAQEVTYGMIESGFKFHTLIQSGLVAGPNNVLALVGRSLSPAFYRGRFWRRRKERVRENLVIDHLGTPNIRVLKQLWLAAAFAFRTVQWRVRTRGSEERILIADAAYVSALPGVLLALSGSRVKKIAIFCDVYAYMGNVSDANRQQSTKQRYLGKLVAAVYKRLNGFVLLTAQMNPIVNPTGKPHMIMEGLVDSEMSGQVNALERKTPNPTVLYAGALREEYGLGVLVDGFRSYRNPEARLKIFGGGDFAAEVISASELDSRISYGGTIPIAEVVAEEERAWLLVNPRPIDQEFAQLSFPSKTMEYLSTGTPVLTTRLPGMPAEYLDYVFTIDAAGAEGVTSALTEVLALSAEELHARGAESKAFVLSEKNDRAQAQRLLAFAAEC